MDHADFHHQNTINKWRNRLDDIRDWHQQLPNTMLHTPSPTIDLTGIRGTTNRIPGGDHLTMLGPYASDATYGDDTPHPTQILTEWAERIANTTPRTFTAAWRWNRDHTPHILTTPYRDAWTQDIHTLWGRLATLTGNHAPTPPTNRGPQDLQAAAQTIPNHTRLTLKEADMAFPGIRNRIEVSRHREHANATKQHRPPNHPCNPDHKGRYLTADLRKHYGATPYHNPEENM